MASLIEKRRENIVKNLSENKLLKVKELAEMMQVTPETIRADLNFLEKKGVLYRVHGGAIAREQDVEVPFEVRNMEQNEIKKQIANQAIHFIRDDSVIYIDASSTALSLGRLLRVRKNLTIFTNSFDLVPLLVDANHHIFVLGGEYYEPGKRLIGPYAIEMLKDIYFDLCVCGMDGSEGLDGPASKASNEHVLIQKVVKQSRTKMLLTDASKFKKSSNFKYATFSDFDILITSNLSESLKSQLKIKTIIEI